MTQPWTCFLSLGCVFEIDSVVVIYKYWRYSTWGSQFQPLGSQAKVSNSVVDANTNIDLVLSLQQFAVAVAIVACINILSLALASSSL